MAKYRVQPTTVELKMREDDFIVSKTDPKGRITYANRIFIEFSGYSERELLKAPHNIIRHPDMPRGVFKYLWTTLEAGKECFAYVKNMSRQGAYYWVFANVTPSYNLRGELDGYMSVRRRPSVEAVKLCGDLYRVMLEAEQQAGPRDAVSASLALLNNHLAQRGLSYEQFILSI